MSANVHRDEMSFICAVMTRVASNGHFHVREAAMLGKLRGCWILMLERIQSPNLGDQQRPAETISPVAVLLHIVAVTAADNPKARLQQDDHNTVTGGMCARARECVRVRVRTCLCARARACERMRGHQVAQDCGPRYPQSYTSLDRKPLWFHRCTK